jgi:ankyrin repeat protein
MHQAALGLLSMSVDQVLRSPAFDQDIEARDKEGKTPIYWAARKGNNTAVQQLIHAGADVNAADVGKDTPLGAASRSCSDVCMQMLLGAGAHVDNKDCFGYTALANVGKWQTKVAFAKVLIQAGASPNSLDIHGATAFARSARYNHCNIGAYLMDHGADINKPDYEGNPPIFEAATADAGEFLVMLLSRGARQDVRNNAGSTLLHVLAMHSSPKTLRILAASRLAKFELVARDRKGRTALELINRRVSISIELRQAFFECMQPSSQQTDQKATLGAAQSISGYRWMMCLTVASLILLLLLPLLANRFQHSSMFQQF